jgi:type VII secretion protein EccE
MAIREAPSRVRAVARVGAAAPAEPGVPLFRPKRRHDRIGAVTVVQLVIVELLLLAVLVAVGRNLLVAAAVAVVAVLVVVVVFGRSRGRWWTETMLLRWQRRQRSGARLVRDDDHRLVALRGLMPDLTVRTVEGPGSAGPVGVARDGSGWFAAVAVLPPEGMRGDPQGSVPLDELARLVIDTEQPGVVLQVLTQTVPAPASVVGVNGRCATSYQELMQASGSVVACDRSTWVALRLDTREVAAASVGSATSEGDMQATVAALIRSMGKRLRRVGLHAEVLTADGLLDALSRSCDLTHQDTSVRAREDWDAWHSTSMSHACFWVQSWPSLANTGALLMRLAGVPAHMTSVAMILEPHQGGIELRCLTRVSAPREVLAQACRQMIVTADQMGAKLFRLNGEQAPAVYATAPTGGGAG